MGLATVLGLARQGYFIPYRYAADTANEPRTSPALSRLFDQSAGQFRDVLATIDGYADDLIAFHGAEPPLPRWEQGWFARLDGAAAYALVRNRPPHRIIEIGSGHSTRFLWKALLDAGAAETCSFTAIDPAPRADIRSLPITHRPALVQSVDASLFADLGPGDILFIDSSHIAMPGTDVDWLVAEVLPGLPAGVRLHVHDITLPDPYPAAWRQRNYNEHTVVAALLAGGGFRPLWSSHYGVTRLAGEVAASAAGRLVLPAGTPETSLWLEKTSPPALSAA